jgi:RimJ/RimL family protein N-acetyltransferase
MTSTPDADISLMIRGAQVGFGPLRRDLIPLYQRWINDLRVTRTLSVPCRPMTLDAETAWYESMLHAVDTVAFTIYELESMRPIGNTTLHTIDEGNDTADFGLLVGETDVWGRGYGTETTRLMLAYGFDVLGLHNIQLFVFANNPGAVRAYERAGFKRSGTRRGALKIGRRRYDIISMDVLAEELAPSYLDELILGNR